MKIIIFFFIFFSLHISSSLAFEENSKQTLNKAYEEAIELIQVRAIFNGSLHNYFNSTNRECIKQKLDLQQSGDKEIDSTEGKFLVLSSVILCGNHDVVFDKLFNEISRGFDETTQKNLDCFKFKLYHLDPNAAILTNFIVESVSIDQAYCDNLSDRMYRYFFAGTDFFCGLNSIDDVKKLAYSIPIIKYEPLDEDLKNENIESVKQNILKMVQNIYNCLIKKIQ